MNERRRCRSVTAVVFVGAVAAVVVLVTDPVSGDAAARLALERLLRTLHLSCTNEGTKWFI